SSRRRHTRFSRDWSSDVCSSDLESLHTKPLELPPNPVHKTNQLLDVQLSQLESLSKLVEAQGEQAVILNEQTALLLRESVKSSRSEERSEGKECRRGRSKQSNMN